MKDQNEIIADLKGLVSIVNDGKEGYKEASEKAKSMELKAMFMEFSMERSTYEDELKSHILQHGGQSSNEEGGFLGALHRTWIDIKEAISTSEDSAILNTIITGEKAAVAKYDEVLKDYETHEDHYSLLMRQREGIDNTLTKIEELAMEYDEN
jgi:uncharacterized protein (TIGR02284 family)